MKTLRALLVLSTIVVTLTVSAANDVLTIGNTTAPKGSILVPVYVRDLSTTRLGVDKPAGQRIQGVGFRVRFTPAGSITSATFTRAGALLKTPLYEKTFTGADWLGYVASFAESNNALAFTSNTAAPGNLIGYLSLNTSTGVTAGTNITITIDRNAAMLSNQVANITETDANNGILLQNGTVTIAAGTCTPPSVSAFVSGSASSCLLGTGGTANATVSGGVAAGYQWGYRTTHNGAITAIPGATQASYVITGSDFGSVGTKYLVVTVLPSCGAQIVSNETTVSITTAPVVTISASSAVFASAPNNFASVEDQGAGTTYTWGITNGTITSGQGTSRIRYTAGASGTVALTVTVTKNGCSDPATPSANVPIIARPAGATMFYVITPCRVVDTRGPNGPYGGPAAPSGSTRQITITGACGIPAGAKSIAANIAAVSPTGAGFLGLYAADIAWPSTSTLNYRTNRTRANNSIIALSADGRISVRNEGVTLHYIIDVTGYFQ
jgi:hypothetical protein